MQGKKPAKSLAGRVSRKKVAMVKESAAPAPGNGRSEAAAARRSSEDSGPAAVENELPIEYIR
jgi:hypothetical protein